MIMHYQRVLVNQLTINGHGWKQQRRHENMSRELLVNVQMHREPPPTDYKSKRSSLL